MVKKKVSKRRKLRKK